MQVPVVDELTERAPSPLALTRGVNAPPKMPPAGRLVIIGAVGVARATANVCGVPSAA